MTPRRFLAAVHAIGARRSALRHVLRADVTACIQDMHPVMRESIQSEMAGRTDRWMRGACAPANLDAIMGYMVEVADRSDPLIRRPARDLSPG